MMRFCPSLICLFILFSVANGGAQTPDSVQQSNKSDSLWYRTVISDRLNEVDEPERGPSLQKMISKAKESAGKKNHYAAMKYYGFALKAEPMNVEALAGYGEAALEISSLDSAETAFRRLVDYGLSPSPDYFPKMRLAEVLFRKGKYSAAADLYESIATLPQTPPVTEAIKRQAKNRYELCLWAQGAGLDNPYVVKNDTCYLLDTANVNTNELYAEYAAGFVDNQLYFSAYRFDLKNDKVKPKRNTIKLLQADGANGPVGPDHPMTVSETLFNDQLLQHTAHLSLNAAGNIAYYAAGNYVKDSAEIRFELFRRRKLPDGNWGIPEKLAAINHPNYTTTEPSLGTLLGENQETLFFVSDRPGGKGGKDIWFSKVFGDSLGQPRPLDALNTPGNDVTPFFHTASNTLFFSSDSLRTLGGFDVYKAKPDQNGTWETPQHMGAPVNSSANDVFFVMGADSKRAFFSSNRIGSANYSEEGCCYDVFAVDFLIRYRALALHGITEKSLPMTRITMYEQDENGKYTAVSSPLDSTSSYTYPVKLGSKYMLVGEKAGFGSDTVYLKTPSELWSYEMVDTLILFPQIKLIASVYDDDTKEPLLAPDLVFFDLGTDDGKGMFKPNYQNGKLDKLPETTHTRTYTLEYGQVYRVLAGKDLYMAAPGIKLDSSNVVSTLNYLNGGTIKVDLYLYYDPLSKYLPLTLYFDNDYPKKDVLNNQDTIKMDYQSTFIEYIRKKEEYKEQFTSVLTGDDKQQALDTLDFFFEQEVRMNWDSFFAFSDIIYEMLGKGDTIVLTLKGYASPLSNPDYNFHLTNRRISSVFNHFMVFDGGAFKPFREGTGNGQLRFDREPNGDSESVKLGVNGDPRNKRQSVYGVDAARSRRVQIVGARVDKVGAQKKI